MNASDVVQGALRRVRDGDAEGARQSLLPLLREDPHNERAWLVLAMTMATDAQRIAVLERCLRVNPESAMARKALAKLQDTSPPTEPDVEPEPAPSPGPVPRWVWFALGGGALIVMLVGLAVLLLPRLRPATPQVASVTATATRPAPSPTPTVTATATVTPTATPDPQAALLETWGMPIVAATTLSDTCGGLLDIAAPTPPPDEGTEELDEMMESMMDEFEMAMGMMLVSGLLEGMRESIETWEPTAALTDVRASLLGHFTVVNSVVQGLMNDQVAPDEIPALLEEECAATRQTVATLLQAAADAGVSLEDVQAAMEERQVEAELARSQPRAEPPEVGESRSVPYPYGATAEAPGWAFQAREVIRGPEAEERVLRADDFNMEAPEGMDYVLVEVHVTSQHADEAEHTLDADDFKLTGADNVVYEDEFGVTLRQKLDVSLQRGWQKSGWCAFLVNEGDEALLLIFDPFFGNPDDTLTYLALEEGAAIEIPPAFAEITPTDLGTTSQYPAYIGETVVAEDWELTLHEVVRGADAEALLEEETGGFGPTPEPGMTYLLARVHARYIGVRDDYYVDIGASDFDLVGRETYDASFFYGLSPTLGATLLPAGESEGWLTYEIPEDAGELELIFQPWGEVSEKNRRIFLVPAP
jgi:nucleotide-binding universal stress UspA family protein